MSEGLSVPALLPSMTMTRKTTKTPVRIVSLLMFFRFDEEIRSIKLYDGYRFPCRNWLRFPGDSSQRLQPGVQGDLNHPSLFGVNCCVDDRVFAWLRR